LRLADSKELAHWAIRSMRTLQSVASNTCLWII
jgi:hypothetical protein